MGKLPSPPLFCNAREGVLLKTFYRALNIYFRQYIYNTKREFLLIWILVVEAGEWPKRRIKKSIKISL